MRIQQIHLDFWVSKKVGLPGWVSLIPERRLKRGPRIDQCVNANAGIGLLGYEIEASNSLNLLRLVRKRGLVSTYMQSHAERVSRKRQAQYRRWLKKIKGKHCEG